MKYQNIEQQVDITAVPGNKVCFKYCPRCNKFLFLPFIRPITVQDRERDTVKFWRGLKPCMFNPSILPPCR